MGLLKDWTLEHNTREQLEKKLAQRDARPSVVLDERTEWKETWLEEAVASTELEDDGEFYVEKIVPTDSGILLTGPATISWKIWMAFQMTRVITMGDSFGMLRTGTPGIRHKALIIEQESSRKEMTKDGKC